MKLKKIISGAKKIVASALIGGGLFTGSAFAQEAQEQKANPVNLETRVIAEENQKLKTQILVTEGTNRLVVETGKGFTKYGINLENKNLQLNAGLIHDYENKDRFNVGAFYKGEKGFIGLEYQSLNNAEKNNRILVSSGLKINKNFELEAIADNNKNARASLFAKTSEKSMIALAGGRNEDGTSVAQGSYSAKLNEKYGLATHLQVGGNDFIDARLRIGSARMPWNYAKVFTVTDNGYNNISRIGDLSDPTCFSRFDFYSADSKVGKETGDIGFDARYIKNNVAYANIAVNAGDVGFLENITVSPRIHKNLATKKDGFRAGLSTELGKTGLKVWYQGTFNENQKSDHAIYLGLKMKL
jgi:hypothetical protein